MPLKQLESYPAGGVSSRDNPVTMPNDRYLLMRNFWPQQDGSLRLRDGYSPYASGIVQGVLPHSIVPITGPGPDYKKLIVFWQGTNPLLLDPATRQVSTTIVRGAPIQSSAKFCYFYTNGHLHAFNGIDAKWFDGFAWRDIGLPKPDADSIAAMSVVASVREFSAAEAAAVTLVLAGAGTFPADVTGRTFYCAIYDLDLQEVGPATIPIGPSNGFNKFALNQELQVAILPSLTNARWRKLPALTDDGKNDAHFLIVSSKQIFQCVFFPHTFALTSTSASDNPTKFPMPSFSASLSAPDLSGGPVSATITGVEQSIPDPTLTNQATLTLSGSDAIFDFVDGHGGHHPIPDGGSIGARIIGTNNFDHTFQVGYGPGVSPGSLATALAASINAEPSKFLSAVATGATVTINPTVAGASNVYSVAPFTHTSEPQYFADNQSFHIATDVGQFGTRTIFDTGTVQITVNGVPATAVYGANDTPASVALALAAAVNGLGVGLQAAPSDATITISFSQKGFFVNMISPNHGFAIDDVIGFSYTGDVAFDGKLFTVLDAVTDIFKIFVPDAVLPISGGTASKILSISGTTATITSPASFPLYRVNDLRGIPGSSIGGPQPGFQFYGSLYNRTAGGHVGNRVPIGQRVVPETRSNVRLIGPLVTSDTEHELLIGRTDDGAEVPHACIDTDGTWLSISGTAGFVAITDADIDGNAELPARNYPPPGTLDFNDQIAPDPAVLSTFQRAWVESDHCCGSLNGSPTVYRSGSAQDLREGKFVGLPEQSWSPVDIETFPTGSPITGGQGYSGESLIFSSEDSATLVELAGELGWQGPYNIGSAGQFSYTKGWKSLPYTLTGEKQLAVGSTDGPTPISDEYEAALLSKIGDKYLADVEMVYVKLPHKRVEVLRINARDTNGLPLTIIHDFNLRDDRSPYGQAYEEEFLGVLSNPAVFEKSGSALSRADGVVTFTFTYSRGSDVPPPIMQVGQKVQIQSGSPADLEGVFDLTSVSVFGTFGFTTLTLTWNQAGPDVAGTGDLSVYPFDAPTIEVVRDENDQPLVLIGATDGNIYRLYDGTSDNGAFFAGEALSLKYLGPQRTAIKYLEWYGDSKAKFFIAKKLTSAFDTSQMQALCPVDDKMPDEASGDEGSDHYQVSLDDPEIIHAYVLLQLTGYEGGTMDLSDPPHMPVETYGRVLLVSPTAGASRP